MCRYFTKISHFSLQEPTPTAIFIKMETLQLNNFISYKTSRTLLQSCFFLRTFMKVAKINILVYCTLTLFLFLRTWFIYLNSLNPNLREGILHFHFIYKYEQLDIHLNYVDTTVSSHNYIQSRFSSLV